VITNITKALGKTSSTPTTTTGSTNTNDIPKPFSKDVTKPVFNVDLSDLQKKIDKNSTSMAESSMMSDRSLGGK
jgi:hypothetical protein